jgi:hypothetical protein
MRGPPVSRRFPRRARLSARRLRVVAMRPRPRAHRALKALFGRAVSASDRHCPPRQPAARLTSRAAPTAHVRSHHSASDRSCLSEPRHRRPRLCTGKPLRHCVLRRAGCRSPLSSVLHAGRELLRRRQLRIVYPIRASTPFDATPVSATTAHRLFVRVEHHRSVLELLHDARCPLARPPMPLAAPPA